MTQVHPMGEDGLGTRMNSSHENVHETAKKTERGVQPAMERTEAVGTTTVTWVLRGHIIAHSRSFLRKRKKKNLKITTMPTSIELLPFLCSRLNMTKHLMSVQSVTAWESWTLWKQDMPAIFDLREATPNVWRQDLKPAISFCTLSWQNRNSQRITCLK
jgi:hypothetical protein